VHLLACTSTANIRIISFELWRRFAVSGCFLVHISAHVTLLDTTHNGDIILTNFDPQVRQEDTLVRNWHVLKSDPIDPTASKAISYGAEISSESEAALLSEETVNHFVSKQLAGWRSW